MKVQVRILKRYLRNSVSQYDMSETHPLCTNISNMLVMYWQGSMKGMFLLFGSQYNYHTPEILVFSITFENEYNSESKGVCSKNYHRLDRCHHHHYRTDHHNHHLKGALKTDFWKNLGFCPNEGGGGV